LKVVFFVLFSLNSGMLFGLEKNIAFCSPIGWNKSGNISLTTALACYYDFGYQTSDKQFCWVRFDDSSPDIEIGESPTKFNAAAFLPTYYANSCTQCHSAT